jgi:hypothetical protein
MHDLPLDDDVTLRMHGLTSTLLSGAEGRDDTRESLYLSPLQTVLKPVDGVVNLVLCHHPPDWFMDQDDADDAIRARAEVQFFGHKHRHRIHTDAAYVRFNAGAVNPDRQAVGWDPGYNLVALSVERDGGLARLAVEAHLLRWQPMPPMFQAIVPWDSGLPAPRPHPRRTRPASSASGRRDVSTAFGKPARA